MDINQLLYVKAIAEAGNLSRAANEILYITQPALTKSIQRLENELGKELFSRPSKNKIILNDAGKTVLKHTEKILAEIDAMKTELKHGPVNNTLRIGYDQVTVVRYLSTKLKEYKPSSDFDLSAVMINNSKFKEALLDDKIDISIINYQISDENIYYMPLINEHVYISVPEGHPLSSKRYLSISDLDGMKFLRQSPKIVPALSNLFKEIENQHIKTDIQYEPDYYVFYDRLETSNEFLGFLSSISKKTSPSKNRRFIPIRDDSAIVNYYVSYLKESDNAALAKFREWLRINRNNVLDLNP